jgi:4'-phosphopantetheinyl transferase
MILSQNIYFVIKNIKVSIEDFNEIKKYLSDEELLKLNSYYFYEDQLRFGLGRYILRTNLSKYLDCSPSDIEIEYNYYGKPFITQAANIYFNISHSMDFVIVVFYEYPIGVDIEYNIKFIDDLINEIFFSSSEINYLNSLSSETKKQEFFKIWTYKESYIKAIGKGMSENPSSIDIMSTRDNILNYKEDTYKILTITDIHPSYSCALCYRAQNINDLPKILQVK